MVTFAAVVLQTSTEPSAWATALIVSPTLIVPASVPRLVKLVPPLIVVSTVVTSLTEANRDVALRAIR